MMVSAREMLRDIDNTGVFEKFESDVNVKFGSVYGNIYEGHADEMTIRTDVGVITVKFKEEWYIAIVESRYLSERIYNHAKPGEYIELLNYILYVLNYFVRYEKNERLENE